MNAITPQQIQQIVPKTPDRDAFNVALMVNLAGTVMELRTVQRMSAVIAMLAFESTGFLTTWGWDRILIKYHLRDCNLLADASDFRAICRAFDKNLSGYGARLLIYKQALKVLRNQ